MSGVVPIFLGDSVEALEVDTKSKGAIFLLDERTRAPWRSERDG